MLPSTFCKNSKNVRVKTSLYLCIKDIQQAGLCILSKYGGSSSILQSGSVQMSVEFDVEQQQHMAINRARARKVHLRCFDCGGN